MLLELDFEVFFAWLCAHKDGDVVGLPGRCFDAPLSRWLSSQEGLLIGVEDARYGSALVDVRCWQQLPYWARAFSAFCENRFGGVLTAYEAVEVLVRVETLLAPVLLVAA